MTEDISELLKLAYTGDIKAVLKLRDLKKGGRSIRAYPKGRLGWWDEGTSPLILTQYFDGSIIILTAYQNEFLFPIPQLGSWIKRVLGLAGSCYALIERLGSGPEVKEDGWFTTEWEVFDGDRANLKFKYGIILRLPENENSVWLWHPRNLMALLSDFEHLLAVNDVPLEETGLDAEWIEKYEFLVAKYREVYE